MNRFLARLTLVIVTLLQYSATVYAGPLDDYYLQQFGEAKSIQLQKAILSVSADVQEPAHCGMPLKHGLRRDWNLLEQSTQKVLAKQLASPVLGDNNSDATYISPSGHFAIHYATRTLTATDQNGNTFILDNRPPAADLNLNNVPDWVETVAATFEDVRANYQQLKGYNPAPTLPAGAPYDVYLLDLAPQGLYGLTTSNLSASSASYPNAVTSWMELDNNFTESIYTNAFGGPYTPLQSLQITAAHEYHHAIQYGYNVFFDVWYAEATSTWMEDELYDGVNQLYNYIPAWFNNSTKSLDLAVGADATTSGAGYGRWIFNRFLAEKHTPVMIRNVWEKVGGLPSPDGRSDIPMIPVLESVLSSATYGSSLGNDFFGFAKRVYTRDWAANPHSSETAKIHPYSPVATYSKYPVNSAVTSPAPPSINLPHYSFAYYKFIPTPGMTSLTISISKTSGIQTALFKNGIELAADTSGTSTTTSYVASGLGTSDEVVLLIANTSSLDGHNANFSTDGLPVAVVEPTPPTSSSSSSGGSGCFIATAAYGSYLHPQVQQLRHFRDDYLLTNAPGRAFVALYYRCSPPLADFIARHTLLRSMTRLLLTPLVFAVAYPLISAVFLFLLIGIVLVSRLRAHSNVRPYFIRNTSSHL